MASNISGFIIDKNNRSNISFIYTSDNNYTRKIFNKNTSVIKNELILTWSSFFVGRRVLKFFIKKYILFPFLS